MFTVLTDPFSRSISYLRLSLTDRCNFRCVYCMAEEMTFVPKQQVLTLEEQLVVAEAFVALGVDKIRLTGGEPLVRHNALWLIEQLGRLDGLNELLMTTNGALLEKYARGLKDAGLTRLNVSLDSLDARQFEQLTRGGDLKQVQAGIEAAQRVGFEHTKLNAVILKGRNDQQVLPLIEYARANGLDISFIEEMPLGHISEHDRQLSFISSSELRQQISAVYPLEASEQHTAGPSRYYQMSDNPIRVGFISPHSNNFCSSCNRVRVTAEGRLLLCLGNEDSLDLRALVRSGASAVDLQRAIVRALQLKPEKHDFDLAQEVEIVRFMNTTGG